MEMGVSEGPSIAIRVTPQLNNICANALAKAEGREE